MGARPKRRPDYLREVEPDEIRIARLSGLSNELAERLRSHPLPARRPEPPPANNGLRIVRQVAVICVLAGLAAATVMILPVMPWERNPERNPDLVTTAPADLAPPSPLAPATAPVAAPDQSAAATPSAPPPTASFPSDGTGEPSAGVTASPVVAQKPVDRELTWDEVHEVQRRLHELALDPGPIDGFKGPLTSAAVRHFEKLMGMPETGRMDFDTLSRLRCASARQSDTCRSPPSTP